MTPTTTQPEESMTYELHPLCTLFPALDDESANALREDMRANGQRTPIILLDGKILDGRNRYLACLEIGIDPIVESFIGDDPLAFVLSVNLHRRHLTEAQRAVIAAELANMKRTDTLAQNRSANLPNGGAPQISQPDAAKMLNVSTRSVTKAKRIQKNAPEVADAVKQGGVSLSAASKVAALPESERKGVVAGGPDAIKAAAKKVEPADPKKADAPADPLADDDLDAGPDLAEIVDELQQENEKLHARLTAVTANDLAAQIDQEVQARLGIEARLSLEMKKNSDLSDDLKTHANRSKSLRKLLHVEKESQIIPAVRGLIEFKQRFQ